MKITKLKSALVAGAVVTMAAVPAVAHYMDRSMESWTPAPAVNEPIPPAVTLGPNETLVTEMPADTAVPIADSPVVHTARAPSIEVTAPPISEDEAINRDVVERLASNQRLSGKIGVQTRNREVTLTGLVNTRGQALLAGREAGSIRNVAYVDNRIRNKVGGYY
jgi:hypothetical protein